MAEVAAGGKSGKVVIRNIGLLLSGDIDHPILDANTLVVNDGLITAVGREKDCDTEGARTVIDARGTCVAPGAVSLTGIITPCNGRPEHPACTIPAQASAAIAARRSNLD